MGIVLYTLIVFTLFVIFAAILQGLTEFSSTAFAVISTAPVFPLGILPFVCLIPFLYSVVKKGLLKPKLPLSLLK